MLQAPDATAGQKIQVLAPHHCTSWLALHHETCQGLLPACDMFSGDAEEHAGLTPTLELGLACPFARALQAAGWREERHEGAEDSRGEASGAFRRNAVSWAAVYQTVQRNTR